MRRLSPHRRLGVAAALSLLLVGCQQSDQALPFELAEGEGAELTVGTTGGTVSLPPAFSIDFPSGSLGGPVTVAVTPRIGAPFPGDEGTPVPGTAFDIGPVGTPLAAPARIRLAVDPALLEVGEDVRLALALVQEDGSVVTYDGAYDLTNGVLVADVDQLGAVAVLTAGVLSFGRAERPEP
ncbi:MAG: hypothetical protein R3253_08840, partial [Longimicrobiales bacterium]|nr:hypothetical protein [Longimicrobiales bacterium]